MRKALLAVAVAASVAGCGSDDESGGDKAAGSSAQTATAEPSGGDKTRAEFIAEADKICAESNASAKKLNVRLQRAIRQSSNDKAAMKAAAPIIDEGNQMQATFDERIRELEPPAADRAVWDKMLTANHQVSEMRELLADTARSGNTKEFVAMAGQIEKVQTRLQGLAQGYGFHECGSGKNEAS